MLYFCKEILYILKTRIFLLLLFTISIAQSFAQNNPNAIADTLNSKLNQIDQKINNAVIKMEESRSPNNKDSIPIFDSLHGKLTIIVRSLKNTSGNVNIALYNNYKAFANHSKPFKGAVIKPTALTCTIIFDSVPKGVYSIAAFHDEDKNGILATNQMNIPTEGYCFSNNIGTTFGPPDYNQIKFYYSGKNKTLILFMTYFKFPK